MKITIVGAGNMGGAIACGLVDNKTNELTVIDHRGNNVDRLKISFPTMNVVIADYTTLETADIVIIALKPWLIESFVKDHISKIISKDNQIIASVAAGISLSQLKEWAGNKSIFRIMPNTAVAVKESMTFLASTNTTDSQNQSMIDIFSQLGKAELIDEKNFSAATSLASCGIAFAFRYIRAAMEGGVELGFYPNQSKETVMQTLKGAIALLEANDSHPEIEIDKVTTAGGITIKGLNEMEQSGFTTAVINGLKASKIG